MHERDLLDSEYPTDDEPRQPVEADPISVAVGAPGFIVRHMLEECQERFVESPVARFPEVFDRFYWEPERTLIDILPDGSPEQLQEQRERKRVEFKTAWCAEHGWLYVALPESDAQDAQRVREHLYAARHHDVVSEPKTPVKREPARRRGQVQRPKATA